MKVALEIIDAVNNWIKYGLNPGSCTELLLRGRYKQAFLHAHPSIKPHWKDHIAYIESLPIECRLENYDSWRDTLKQRNKINE